MNDEDQSIVDSISGDLPYELQSKLFDQLAAGGIAGAGLTITLVGTILNGSVLIWMSTVEFATAALVALTGQTHMIDGLFDRKPVRKRSKWITAISITLIGMGVGSLATSVYLEGKTGKDASIERKNGAAGED